MGALSSWRESVATQTLSQVARCKVLGLLEQPSDLSVLISL